MDRRHFLKGIATLGAFGGTTHAAPSQYRVCVLGVGGRAISAADAIRWSAPFWLDQEHFALSVLLLWREWGPQRTMIGAFGEVPGQCIRGWRDLSWMAEDLRNMDCALLQVDLWCEARDGIAANVIREAQTLVPNVAVFALDRWNVAEGRLVPDADPSVTQARLRVLAACDAVQLIPGNGAEAARLLLAAERHGARELEWGQREACHRRVNWSETDQLASPVIRRLASASRAHILPSSTRARG